MLHPSIGNYSRFTYKHDAMSGLRPFHYFMSIKCLESISKLLSMLLSRIC